MSYIIITVISVAVLLVTTMKRVEKNDKRNRKRTVLRCNKDAIADVIQQIIIVFLSAVLAMGLTEYVEKKTVIDRVGAFVPVMLDRSYGNLSNGIIRDCYKEESEEKGSDKQLIKIAKDIAEIEDTLFETMMYNDDFIATLAPMSYFLLHSDYQTQKYMRDQFKNIDETNIDRQAVAENIADYLQSSTNITISLDFLKADVRFDLLNLLLIDENYFKYNIHYKNYCESIKMLEELFDVDLKSWEDKIRYYPQNAVE